MAIAAFRLALSNGWSLSELDPRKLFSKGDDAAPPAATEAESPPASNPNPKPNPKPNPSLT